MRCPSCGSEMPDDRKFCTTCGAPLGERTIEMKSAAPAPPAPPASGAPAPPGPTRVMSSVPGGAQAPSGGPQPPLSAAAPPGYPPAGKARGLAKRRWIIIACVVGFLVLGGAAAGIATWLVGSGGKTVANISDLVLSRSDGRKLDPDNVPLDVELSLAATFTAKFKEGGKAVLKLSVVDENGGDLVEESYRLESSGDPQEETLEFTMTSGTGEPLEARAELEVTVGGDTTSDDVGLEFAAVEGEGEEARLEAAKERAAKELAAADTAVQTLTSMGIEAGDLAEQVADAEVQLDEAATVAEAEAVLELASGIIAECAVRAADADSRNEDAANVQACRANQAAIRSALNAYYAAEGNFPDSMTDLVTGRFLQSLPGCPSGGSYTYEVTDFAGPAFDVICSVHGSL